MVPIGTVIARIKVGAGAAAPSSCRPLQSPVREIEDAVVVEEIPFQLPRQHNPNQLKPAAYVSIRHLY
ncbi:MAG: hypothetical protein U0T56_11550 [Ferruginibacter sp.]